MIPDKLQRCLSDYDMAMLRALAQTRGEALTTNRQSEAVDQLATALLEPLSVRTAVSRLSPEARSALDSLLAAGGRLRAPHFARRFGQIRAFGPGRLEREALWQEPANATEELWFTALLFRGFYEDKGGPGEFFFVPADLRRLLPSPPDEPPPFSITNVPAPGPETKSASLRRPGEALVHDVFVYLVLLQNRDVRLYADGRLAKHDLAFLRRRIRDASERRLTFIRHIVERAGLVTRQGGYLRLNSSPVKRWLSDPLAQQLAALQQYWRDDPDWNDLCLVPSLRCDHQTPWRNNPVATRHAILALLARCPTDGWWSLDSFVTAVKGFHPDFQRPDGDYDSWYIRDAANGEYLSGFDSWDRVEGALLADLLNGILNWLGIVTTASDPSLPGPVYHLTGAGARLLGLEPGPEPAPDAPPIEVQSDFYIELPPPTSLYTQFQLERFTEPIDSNAVPRRYQLTVGSLGRALAQGVRVEQILAFLQQAGERPVPPNVAGQLRMWAGRFGQVKLEEVAVLSVKSERVLKELSVLPETRSLIDRILSPTTALVRKKNLSRLRRELRQLGFLHPPGDADDRAERG
jgi:hypothetical protein